MGKNQNAVSIMHMFTHPVFSVRDGIIIEVNNGAKQLMIQPNTALTPLLDTDSTAYRDFTGGALSLTLNISGHQFITTVLRSDETDYFHINSITEETDLRSLSVTAQCMREPLATIMTVSEQMFAQKSADDPESQYAGQLNRSTYQLLRIISNMNDAATCKNRTYAMETLDLPALISSNAEALSSLVEKAGRTLHFNGIQEHIYTLCDRDMLERALCNLISNAIKYSPNGTQIEIGLKKTDNRILISVTNSCDHFLNEEFGTIFSQYRREPGIYDGQKGVGLGIPMVRAAAAAHKGTLLLTQDAEKNVTFTMSVAIRTDNKNQLRSPIMEIDYAGGRDHKILELSDVLPVELFK